MVTKLHPNHAHSLCLNLWLGRTCSQMCTRNCEKSVISSPVPMMWVTYPSVFSNFCTCMQRISGMFVYEDQRNVTSIPFLLSWLICMCMHQYRSLFIVSIRNIIQLMTSTVADLCDFLIHHQLHNKVYAATLILWH